MKPLRILLVLALVLGDSVAWAQSGSTDRGGTVSVDFHDVDIQDVAKSISEITGKNFILDDKVHGKVTIISPSPVTIQEAYQMFLSALEVKSYCTVEVGKVTKIVPIRECVGSAIPLESELSKTQGDQPITKIIKLKYMNANDMRQALDSLRSRSGKMVAIGTTNSIIVTDVASNVRRLEKLIREMDKENFKASVEIIPLKHAGADEVAQKLTTIYDAQKRDPSKRRRRGDDVDATDDVIQITPDARTNSLMVVATREGLSRILDLVEMIDVPAAQVPGTGNFHVKKLEHADAEEMATLLSSLLSGTAASAKKKKDEKTGAQKRGWTSGVSMPWEEGGAGDTGAMGAEKKTANGSGVAQASGTVEGDVHVVADPSINALVITASPSDYQALLGVIDRLDVPRPQVFVETLIMEVNIQKALEVGVAGHGAGSPTSNTGVFGATNLGGPTSIAASQNPASLATTTGLILGGGSTQKFRIPGTELFIPISGAIFRAYQDSGALNVLSAPNILTTDNKKAEINVGRNISYMTSQTPTTSGPPVTSFSREKVGLMLAVTPQINEGGSVTLEIEQKTEEADEAEMKAGKSNPTTDERTAKTTVIAEDGQTIVIGGLIKDKEQKTTTKVPLLGDIPLVGYLFRNSSVIRSKQNLVIFLTPHVIHEPKDLTRVSVKKNSERQKFNKAQGIGENKALYDYDLDSGLNMAPPPKRSKEDEQAPKRRFDYDRPDDESAPSSVEERDTVSRRSERRPTQEEAKADLNAPRRRTKSSSPSSGNPFSEVRPPSSNP